MQNLILQGLQQKLQKSCSRCNKNTWHVESSYILQPPKYLLLFVNRFRYINNNVTKDRCSIPVDTTVRLGALKFSLRATIDHHGPSIHSGHYTRMLVTFGICFKQHFHTRYLVFYNPSPPRMFLSLDLLSEYRIQHGAIGSLYVTTSYSTWIFCRGVSGFATDCPCGVWCRGLTTCLLHVGPPFGNRFLNNSWAVGVTWWIVYLFFCILTYAIIYVLIHYIIFWLYLYFINNLYFFKYSCTNIFHRRSLYTFYQDCINIEYCSVCIRAISIYQRLVA